MAFKKKVEEFSKIVSKTATDTYNTVADKSGKLLEDTKLKISVSDNESEIKEICENMGNTIYESYKSAQEVDKNFVKECKRIDKLKKEIAEMNNKILYNKGLRVCNKCKDTIAIESTFCKSCGSKQKAIKVKEDKKEEEIEKPEKITEVVCGQCGFVCTSDYKFCTKCGYNFKD